MKSKKLLFLTIFLIFVISCARLKGPDAYLFIPELYHKSGNIAYDNGNIKVALHLAKENCDNQNSDECNLLGRLYEEGRYLSQSDTKAVQYYNKGCVDNNGFSCLYLGDMYNTGKGTVQSDKKRDELYNKAFDIFLTGCNDNKSEDCRGLGISYLNNYLTDPYEKAVDYLTKSCDLGNSKGCLELANHYFYKEQNKDKSFEFYEKACSLHNPEGCIRVIDMYNRDKSKNKLDVKDIIYRSDKMCKSGASNLCVYLGEMYRQYSRLSKIDAEKSFDYMRYSCEFNNPYGCKVLADMYFTGFGVAANSSYSKSYYNKSCSLGFSAACNSK